MHCYNEERWLHFCSKQAKNQFQLTKFATASFSRDVLAGNNSINTSHDTEVTSSNISKKRKYHRSLSYVYKSIRSFLYLKIVNIDIDVVRGQDHPHPRLSWCPLKSPSPLYPPQAEAE